MLLSRSLDKILDKRMWKKTTNLAVLGIAVLLLSVAVSLPLASAKPERYDPLPGVGGHFASPKGLDNKNHNEFDDWHYKGPSNDQNENLELHCEAWDLDTGSKPDLNGNAC